MKTLLRLFLLPGFLLPLCAFANITVYVHGYVKYPNGTPAAGILVNVSVAQATCQIDHNRITNATGFYSDTLICSNTIYQVTTRIVDPCTNTQILHTQAPNANFLVESNFTICNVAPNTCFSNFTWRDSLNQVYFFSTGSLQDSIVSRVWTFGDSTTLNGNVKNPVHTYIGPGVYNACLKTRSLSGCEKTTCNYVTVLPGTNCFAVAAFSYRNSPTTLYRILFNSTASLVAYGDTIVSRRWWFGDGDTISGNVIIPEHTYPGYGTYTVSLFIKTRLGCEKMYSYVIIIENPQTSCRANLSTTYLGPNATGYLVRYDSTGSTATYGDAIVECRWTFGDGTSTTGASSTHTYTLPGTYTICLKITSATGCRDSVCKTISVPNLHCQANFYVDSIAAPAGGNTALHYFKFNSTRSYGSFANDSITSRKWKFGDGDSLAGNVAVPVHGYARSGTYTVCLYIVTASGCKDSSCTTVTVRINAASCQSRFTTTANGLLVTFNASTTTIAAGDSIISRSWTLGDGATNTANVLTHQYPQAGVYSACLTIRTRLGCTATICKPIAVVPVAGNCVPYFTKEQTNAARTIRFNSSAAYSQIPNDSIIRRKWEFGDGQVLMGNAVNPLHTYLYGGTYTACLTIYTAQCDKRWCQTVQVFPMDSTTVTDSVGIVNLYPVPVISPLYAVLYSSRPNVTAQLTIYDVYGVLKWTQNTVLPYGNSTHTIPTSQLTAGSYVFKVTTVYGIKSRPFYKIN